MKTLSRLSLIVLFFGIACRPSDAQLSLQSDELKIEAITKNAYVHKSYLQTESFGKVECNGAIFVSKNEALIMDTPSDSATAVLLIDFLQKNNIKIKGVVVNHFHGDCLGGLSAFHAIGVPSYASNLTIEAAKKANVTVPQIGFNKTQTLKIGNKEVKNMYLGEAHTSDNIVTYFPSEKTLFGGCMVKEVNATKGYLGDANIASWPKTIENIKKTLPEAQFIIPGHGKIGGQELLNYTIMLFSEK